VIVLAVDEYTMRELAAAAVASRLSLALRPGTSK
jgi:Flp pilus assembly protein CpaB